MPDGWWYDDWKIDAPTAAMLQQRSRGAGWRLETRRALMDETDIWRTARALIDEYGDRAPAEAATRAEALLDLEELEGRAVWLRVSEAAQALLKKKPARTVH